jgi:hypothetical protein
MKIIKKMIDHDVETSHAGSTDDLKMDEVAFFLADETVGALDEAIRVEDLYEHFRCWMMYHGMIPYVESEFLTVLQSLGVEVHELNIGKIVPDLMLIIHT